MTEPEPIEKPSITPAQFLDWRSPRLGDANPSVMSNPLWRWLVGTRMSAYQGNKAWDGPSSFDAGPMWCFDRFGQSNTTLPDGRVVCIAGEHEDHYDPDFFIYNDVVVTQPDGAITIFGYPKSVFPPTDFHTATLLPDRIMLIGSLGYPDDRAPGSTQVLELMLDTFEIRRVEITGPSPGWISRHTATLTPSGESIVVSGGDVLRDPEPRQWENTDDWAFNLASSTWSRLTHRQWQQWTFVRTDRKPNRLWQIRHALWLRKVRWQADLDKQMQQLVAELGFVPDLDLVSTLYRADESMAELPPAEDEYNIFRVSVDGITVRFTEEGFLVQAVVEGALQQRVLDRLQQSILDKLSRLHGANWTLHKSS